MKKVIPIDKTESDAVQALFTEYNCYLDLFNALGDKNGTAMKEALNDQFQKAVLTNTKLSLLKESLRHKYQPKGEEFETYTFDFGNSAIVFEK